MEKLIFVYNADSGKWNAYLDMAHKILSPKTYPCSLCDLTYGIFKIQPEWDDFVKNSPITFEFLHKDEFQTQYPQFKDLTLPLILKQCKADLTVFIDKIQLDTFKTIPELKEDILNKIRSSNN
jgi:hypothetical protein